MLLDRDTLATAVVGTGGAWLLATALLHGHTGRYSAAERRGLLYAGAGFLLSAVAARWLRHLGVAGVVVSLTGTLVALRGMYLLVRARAARREQGKPRSPE
jgi:hypothetical protein